MADLSPMLFGKILFIKIFPVAVQIILSFRKLFCNNFIGFFEEVFCSSPSVSLSNTFKLTSATSQLFETSAKADSECDHVESIFLTLAHKLRASKPMMPASSLGSAISSGVSVDPGGGIIGDRSDIAAAMEEMHRAETTAALLDSGLVDIRSGDRTGDFVYGPRQDDPCC